MTVKVIAIQSSPNLGGLTCQMVQAALEGAESEGAQVELVHLNEFSVESCMAHDRGWGTCRTEGKCLIEDDFQALREKINNADALVFSTPVYFGDVSESAKRFLDRWRRCETFNREASALKEKPVIGIAAAGGSGRGVVTALRGLETYLRWLQFTVFDLVTATRVSKDHKVVMLEAAGRRIVTSAEKGEDS